MDLLNGIFKLFAFIFEKIGNLAKYNPCWGYFCLLYTSPSPRDGLLSRMPSSA